MSHTSKAAVIRIEKGLILVVKLPDPVRLEPLLCTASMGNRGQSLAPTLRWTRRASPTLNGERRFGVKGLKQCLTLNAVWR